MASYDFLDMFPVEFLALCEDILGEIRKDRFSTNVIAKLYLFWIGGQDFEATLISNLLRREDFQPSVKLDLLHSMPSFVHTREHRRLCAKLTPMKLLPFGLWWGPIGRDRWDVRTGQREGHEKIVGTISRSEDCTKFVVRDETKAPIQTLEVATLTDALMYLEIAYRDSNDEQDCNDEQEFNEEYDYDEEDLFF